MCVEVGMPTQRVQQQIERLFCTVETAVEESDWHCVERVARDVLALDPENRDALTYLEAADRRKQEWDVEAPVQGRPWTQAEDEELRELAGEWRATDIARRMNRSAGAIYKRGAELGILLRYRGPYCRSRLSKVP